jgi:hypothetical protein
VTLAKTFIKITPPYKLNQLLSKCVPKWNCSCALPQYPLATWQKKSQHPSFGSRYKAYQVVITMVISFPKLTKFVAKSIACTPCHHFHTRPIPHLFSYSSAFWTLYFQCDDMQCFKLNIAYNHLWNRVHKNTHCLPYTMKGMIHWGWYMWAHVPKTHPSSNTYGWVSGAIICEGFMCLPKQLTLSMCGLG